MCKVWGGRAVSVITEILNKRKLCIAETLHNLTMVTVSSENINYGAKGLYSGEHKYKDQIGRLPAR